MQVDAILDIPFPTIDCEYKSVSSSPLCCPAHLLQLPQRPFVCWMHTEAVAAH